MAQIDPPCKTQVGDRGCMSQQDDHHLSTVPPYRRHLSNDIISHECQITQCNQCTCSCFSKPQSSRQSKQYVQNVSSTNGIHHHQCCQSQLVFECQQKQDCSSKFFARHNTQYNLSGVHVFQADPRHPLLQDHQTRQKVQDHPRSQSNFSPYPIWLSPGQDSEGPASPQDSSTYQRAIELMAAMQTLSTNDRTGIPLPPHPQTVLRDEELRTVLPVGDIEEIMNLQELYLDVMSAFPSPEIVNVDEVERLWRLYGAFVERQSLFFTKLPMLRLLDVRDRWKLLRLAVGISTHVSAAHLLDSNEYTWPRRDSPFITTKSKMVSASTIRKILSQEHFILLMTFYMRYTHLFADPKVALIMLVLSLFSDEPGLNDVDAVNLGRQHYLGLLSRYLTAVHGRQGGSEILRALLVSKEEARQLSDIHNHIELHNDIELSPQTRHNLRDMTDTLAVNFQLVCVSAKETILKARRRLNHPNSTETALAPSTDSNTYRHVNTIKNLLARLAECEDPGVLTLARHLLPPHLLYRFLQLIQR